MLWTLLFGFGLVAASAMAWKLGTTQLRRTAVALICAWLAAVVIAVTTGRYDMWLAFIVIDAVAAWVVLAHPSSRPQAIIGLIFVIQISTHLAYALVGSAVAQSMYLDMLAAGGWLQIATLAWGAIYGGGRKIEFGGPGGGNSAAADTTHHRSMGPGQ